MTETETVPEAHHDVFLRGGAEPIAAETAGTSAASGPRRPAPAPRVRPSRSNGHASNESSESKLDRLLALVERQDARIAALESGDGQMRYIPATPEPRPDQRVVDPSSLSPFLQKILERTHEVPEDFESSKREPSYNYPLRLYLKPDGTVVSLQGDPNNRALYTDKGFYCLLDDEAKHYREVEYPKILAETRRKAHLIGTIRKMFQREPSLVGFRDDNDYDASLNVMSVPQLEDEFDDLRKRSINPGQKLPPMPRFRSDTEKPDKAMVGVDTGRETLESLQEKRSRSRDIEVTPLNANQFR